VTPVDHPPDPGQRPIPIGPFNAVQPGATRARTIPAPWIDCPQCGWRHYPSTSGGRWQIATACASCRAPLENG
jgi:hypothetical protein